MVPVMITAPTVVKRRAKEQWAWLRSKTARKAKPVADTTAAE
jgi:hypothetical protein